MFARIAGVLGLLVASGLCDDKQVDLDVPYEPTHPQVVEAMLKLGGVNAKDLLYDLGCGDGRIVVAAAEKCGARGVGVDIDPQRIKEANENAKAAGVADRVKFLNADLKEIELSGATVVTLYLLNSINLMVRPMLFRDLEPGARVVSHCFTMGEWNEDKKVEHAKARDDTVLMWVIPAPAGGVWQWTEQAAGGEARYDLRLEQSFQKVSGTLSTGAGEKVKVEGGSLAGRTMVFTVRIPVIEQAAAEQAAGEGDAKGTKTKRPAKKAKSKTIRVRFEGTVQGSTVEGTQDWQGGPSAGKRPWKATLTPVKHAGDWRIACKTRKEDAGPNGTLRIATTASGKPKAVFIADGAKEETPVPALYLWGASIRFDVETDEETYEFTGFIDGSSASGRMEKSGTGTKVAWTADRLAAE